VDPLPLFTLSGRRQLDYIAAGATELCAIGYGAITWRNADGLPRLILRR
jgi:hypothetical protein